MFYYNEFEFFGVWFWSFTDEGFEHDFVNRMNFEGFLVRILIIEEIKPVFFFSISIEILLLET